MAWNEQIQVLRAFNPFARSLTIHDAANFRWTNNRRRIAQNIVRAIGCILLCLSLAVTSLLGCWTFADLNRAMGERVFDISMALCSLHQLLIFIAMQRKGRQIIDAQQRSQATIDRRECINAGKFTRRSGQSRLLKSALYLIKRFRFYYPV